MFISPTLVIISEFSFFPVLFGTFGSRSVLQENLSAEASFAYKQYGLLLFPQINVFLMQTRWFGTWLDFDMLIEREQTLQKTSNLPM